MVRDVSGRSWNPPQRVRDTFENHPDLALLHVSVSDSAVFSYSLYRNASRVDHFTSIPGYFGDSEEEEIDSSRGDVRHFSDVCPTRLRELDNTLHEIFGDPEAQLASFAAVLNLANTHTCYEYLCGGRTADVIRFAEFVHV